MKSPRERLDDAGSVPEKTRSNRRKVETWLEYCAPPMTRERFDVLIVAIASALAGSALSACDFVLMLQDTGAALAHQPGGLAIAFAQAVGVGSLFGLVVGTAALTVRFVCVRLIEHGIPRWLVIGGIAMGATAIYLVAIGIPSLRKPTLFKIAVQCALGGGFALVALAGIALAAPGDLLPTWRKRMAFAALGVLAVATLGANLRLYPLLYSRMHAVLAALPTVWVAFAFRQALLKTGARKGHLVLAFATIALVASTASANPFSRFVSYRLTGYTKVAANSFDAVRGALGGGSKPPRYACRTAGVQSANVMASPQWTIVVLADTLRADRVFHSEAEEAFRDLRAASVAFSNAHSQYGCTDHSVRSVLVSGYDFAQPGARATAFTSAIRAAGVQDVAVATTDLVRRFYLKAGFASAGPANTDHETVERAKEWLSTRTGQRAFLWVHLLAAHRHGLADDTSYDQRVVQSARHLDDLITFADAAAGAANVSIVFLADHGESLGEHGLDEHCATAYSAVSHVPLLLRVPGVPATTRSEPVELIDLLPTLLRTYQQPCEWCTGHDLLAASSPPSCAVHMGMAVRSQLIALTCDRWKLLEDRTFEFAELYDLSTDPHETVNLAATRPDIVREMRQRLEAKLVSPMACAEN